MELKNIIFIVFLIFALGLFTWSCRKLITYMLLTRKKDDRFDRPGERLKRVWTIAFAQTKLLRDPKAGLLHFTIFWGFVLFLFAVIEAFHSRFLFSFQLAFCWAILFSNNNYTGLLLDTCNCSLSLCIIQKIRNSYSQT